MPITCQKSTSGGKGNIGKYIERDTRVCAAGIPSSQPHDNVCDNLQRYLLQDEVDGLLSDSIHPEPVKRPLPPLRHPIPLDKRNAAGTFGDVAQIVNPPVKNKFLTLVDDFKDTSYTSYWNKPLGKVKDPAPMLPDGFDTLNTTLGKKTPFHGRLYDIIMPKEPVPDKTPKSQGPGVQIDRNYCKPAFNRNSTFGHKSSLDKRGIYVKCALTDDKIKTGNSEYVIVNTIQSSLKDQKSAPIGKVFAPNQNIKEVPKGYTFGRLKPPENLPECLTYCELNPGNVFFRKCLAHLNSLRKCLTTKLLPNFFNPFYLSLKYYDANNSGWLPKNVVYDRCAIYNIRFDPTLIEPLLSLYNAFDGKCIEYKTFVHVLNYKEPSPEFPKIENIQKDCLDFLTTYREMTRPGQKSDTRYLAGLPSGRYFDRDYPVTPENCCKADRTCLPHESDMKSCLCPSVMTLMQINHRDMYAKRDQASIKRVFEAAGEKFTEERFKKIWEKATINHSQGWVSYETFRRALEKN